MRFALGLLVLVYSIGSAHADDKTKARAAFKEAAQHFRLAEYEQALASFQEAYRNFADPRFLFNIGQCQRQLGHKEDAIRSYKGYLSEVPEAQNRGEVELIIAKLEAALADEQAAVAAQKAREAEAARPPPAVIVAAPPPAPPPKTPVHKKWWLWTIVGAGAVGVGLGLGLGLGLHQGSSTALAGTTFGIAQPFK